MFSTRRMKPQQLGPVFDTICGRCHNPVAYELYRRRCRVEVFWIPLVPAATRHYVLCPICRRGARVSSTQLPTVKALVEVRRQLDDGQITRHAFAPLEAHYLALLDQDPYVDRLMART